jgi:hypothetical protein
MRGRRDNESLDTSPPPTRATASAEATAKTTTQHILEAAVQFGI